MEKEQSGKPKIEGLVVLAEGMLSGNVTSNDALRILEKSRLRYQLRDNSLLNIAFIPTGSDKYEYMVYANIPNAPLPMNYQIRKGLINYIGGKVVSPIVTVLQKTNAQKFEELFAPAPEQYGEGAIK
jgi:hypothetical protein